MDDFIQHPSTRNREMNNASLKLPRSVRYYWPCIIYITDDQSWLVAFSVRQQPMILFSSDCPFLLLFCTDLNPPTQYRRRGIFHGKKKSWCRFSTSPKECHATWAGVRTYVLQTFDCTGRGKARILGVLRTVILRFDLHWQYGRSEYFSSQSMDTVQII